MPCKSLCAHLVRVRVCLCANHEIIKFAEKQIGLKH